ncbi:hypothetical protein PILCRDRAFT_814181 [Piloderma croceum F 1598]|uniref:Uncharacterized protein n=1 Tax=Piloderma croceum (strain F 1598) TaxID=765440 RepID=A0A0C3G937_PILCF|nr:hypothetical protein PILCRDRAFT_814181 [Piloderma croceum F 1598]
MGEQSIIVCRNFGAACDFGQNSGRDFATLALGHRSITIEYYFQLYGQTSRDGVHRQICLILHPLSHKLAIHSRNCTAIRHLLPKTAPNI